MNSSPKTASPMVDSLGVLQQLGLVPPTEDVLAAAGSADTD
ncbi:MAG: hypothetical protein WAV47_21885 [Blastocatellia bacterium]